MFDELHINGKPLSAYAHWIVERMLASEDPRTRAAAVVAESLERVLRELELAKGWERAELVKTLGPSAN